MCKSKFSWICGHFTNVARSAWEKTELQIATEISKKVTAFSLDEERFGTETTYTLKNNVGFPGGAVVEKSACQCRGHGFEPWSGKIPHAAEQLGPWATAAEPARLEPVLRNKRGHDSERPAHRDEERPPLSATRESPRTEMKTQHSQK